MSSEEKSLLEILEKLTTILANTTVIVTTMVLAIKAKKAKKPQKPRPRKKRR